MKESQASQCNEKYVRAARAGSRKNDNNTYIYIYNYDNIVGTWYI